MDTKIFIGLGILLAAVPGLMKAFEDAGLVSGTVMTIISTVAVGIGVALQKKKKEEPAPLTTTVVEQAKANLPPPPPGAK